MFQEFKGIEIKAISSCVPKNTIKNSKFDYLFNEKEIKNFEKNVGIFERRWADDSITSSDLGYYAAKSIVESNEFDLKSVDALIFLSQTSDYKLPFSSNLLQKKLNLNKDILCLDVNAGCAGFVQGLSLAFSIAKSKEKSKVLLIIGETLSKVLSKNDKSTSLLFGDGASAIYIHNSGNEDVEMFSNVFSDGLNADAIIIPDGGSRNPFSLDSLIERKDEKGNVKNNLQISMDGAKVFDFTLREVQDSIDSLLENSKTKKDSIDYFLLHQSNKFIIKQISNRLNVDFDKFLINIDKYGNTSGVSIPLLMNDYSEKLKTSSNLLISGYGVGLNWGNVLLKNHNITYFNINEI